MGLIIYATYYDCDPLETKVSNKSNMQDWMGNSCAILVKVLFSRTDIEKWYCWRQLEQCELRYLQLGYFNYHIAKYVRIKLWNPVPFRFPMWRVKVCFLTTRMGDQYSTAMVMQIQLLWSERPPWASDFSSNKTKWVQKYLLKLKTAKSTQSAIKQNQEHGLPNFYGKRQHPIFWIVSRAAAAEITINVIRNRLK
jgi:hypothetical protein